MYYLVSNEDNLSISLYFTDDDELSDIYYYETINEYKQALDLFLNVILK